MKSFGQAGLSIVSFPRLIEEYLTDKYAVNIIGRVEEIKRQYYIFSSERR
jgi:LysR family transcriptional activator of nhaA